MKISVGPLKPRGLFKLKKIRQNQNLAYYFYGFLKWAFTDSSVSLSFFNSPHQFTDGWQTCKIIKTYFLLNKYGYNNGIHCDFTTECLSLTA